MKCLESNGAKERKMQFSAVGWREDNLGSASVYPSCNSNTVCEEILNSFMLSDHHEDHWMTGFNFWARLLKKNEQVLLITGCFNHMTLDLSCCETLKIRKNTNSSKRPQGNTEVCLSVTVSLYHSITLSHVTVMWLHFAV